MYKSKLTKVILTTVISVPFMVGCGLFKGEKEPVLQEIDPPQDVQLVDEPKNEQQTENETMTNDTAQEAIMTELYLIDQNGLVASQVLPLPKTKSVAKQALEYLVKDGPVEELLPNGFQAVLPAGTEVLGVNLLEDGTIIADFSSEFANYAPEDEKKILQAITWTLTQFENVKRVKIRINGVDQEVMPVNQTPIHDGVSRADGINFEQDHIADITKSKAVTLYFLAQNEDKTYFVPVTRRISTNEDIVTATVKELVKGPSLPGLVSDFRSQVKLLSKPSVEDGVVTLNFNEAILGALQGTAISDGVLQSLVLSLTELSNIEKVSIQVNGSSDVLKASGEKLVEPVVRPTTINAVSF